MTEIIFFLKDLLEFRFIVCLVSCCRLHPQALTKRLLLNSSFTSVASCTVGQQCPSTPRTDRVSRHDSLAFLSKSYFSYLKLTTHSQACSSRDHALFPWEVFRFISRTFVNLKTCLLIHHWPQWQDRCILSRPVCKKWTTIQVVN